jgi:hypothetical protein
MVICANAAGASNFIDFLKSKLMCATRFAGLPNAPTRYSGH